LFQVIIILLQEFLYIFIARPRKSIKGKIALVTGAGHGVGKVLVEKLANLGATVVLVDINKENNDGVASQLRSKGYTKVHSYDCDVSNEQKVKQLKAKVKQEVGDVYLLVNNAGVVNCVDLLQLTEAKVQRTFNVNVLAHMWLIREFLPDMMSCREGHIVGVSSVAGITGTAYLTDYCASKCCSWTDERLGGRVVLQGSARLHQAHNDMSCGDKHGHV